VQHLTEVMLCLPRLVPRPSYHSICHL